MPRQSLATLLLSATALSCLADGLAVTVGVQHNQYQDPGFRENTVPVDLNYQAGDWTFDLVDTYFSRSAIAARVPTGKGSHAGMRAIKVGGRTIWVPKPPKPKAGLGAQEGMGDMTLSATYPALDGDGLLPNVDVTAGITLPTGELAKGFSTGATEGGLTTVLSWDQDHASYTVTFQRNLNGDVKGEQTRNTWSASVGASYRPTEQLTLGAAYDIGQASDARGNASRMVSLSLSYALNRSNKISFTGGHGFGPSDPDQSIGLSYNHHF
jgi:opacity protein-like surface antigen